MLDLLPDLTGRPDWVVLVAIALAIGGWVAAKWIVRRSGDEDEEGAEGDRPAGGAHRVPASPDDPTTQVLTKALDLLAREAVESQEARDENGKLRADLIACSTERDQLAQAVDKAHADLEQCNRECRRLAMRALEQGGNSGE